MILTNVTPSQPPAPTTACDYGQIIREGVTAVLSLGIALIALAMLVDTYLTAKAPKGSTEFATQKDILLLALGFLGTVTGYYLGRVPAERHADTARSAAAKAIENEYKIRQHVRVGLDAIEQKRIAAGGATGDALSQEINRLRAILG
jgi:hypothetical protein